MKYKKTLLIVCLLACVIFSISGVMASDVNETTIANEDQQQTIAQTDAQLDYLSADDNEQTIEGITEEASAIQETDKNTISIDENDNAKNKEITAEEPVLTKSTADDNVLSAKNDLKTLKITFTKQTGKYNYNKKVYFKITDEDTGKPVKNAQIYYKVYNSKGALETYGYAEPNSNGIGYIKFTDGKIHIGTFKIKATLYWWGDEYGDEAYIYGDTIKNVKIYKSAKDKTTKGKLKVDAPKVTKTYNKYGIFKVTVKNDITRKPVKGIKVKIKISDDEGYYLYTVKTNKNGIAKINTKKLDAGNYKVTVKVKATKKYKSKTVKSSIKIKKANSKTTSSSKISNTKTNNNPKKSNGKIVTNIQCKGSFEQDTNNYQNYYPVISFTPTLKDSNGKTISGNYKATLKYFSYYGDEQYHTETFKGKFGEYKSYTGAPGGLDRYQLIITYDGDSQHTSATWKSDIGHRVVFK